MHFALFFGGLSVLVGSCLIVCVCNRCKRRKMCKRKKKQNSARAPSISYIKEDSLTLPHFGSIRYLDSPMFPPKRLISSHNDSPEFSVTSKESTDSTKSLLCNKDSVPLSHGLRILPGFLGDHTRQNNLPPIIPTIYIDSTCTTSTA